MTVARPDDPNQHTIDEFRANHGQVGGNFAGAPLLLLHTVGARSGQPRTTMAVYAATKAFVLSFTEALWWESRGSGIRVLALPRRHPDGVLRPVQRSVQDLRPPERRSGRGGHADRSTARRPPWCLA